MTIKSNVDESVDDGDKLPPATVNTDGSLPEAPFQFEPGMLYLRVMDHGKKLHFEEPGKQWHMRSIAKIQGGQPEANFGGSFECFRERAGCSNAGRSITHIRATDDELKTIIAAWDTERYTVEMWLEYVDEEQGLNATEKERLRRLAREVAEAAAIRGDLND